MSTLSSQRWILRPDIRVGTQDPVPGAAKDPTRVRCTGDVGRRSAGCAADAKQTQRHARPMQMKRKRNARKAQEKRNSGAVSEYTARTIWHYRTASRQPLKRSFSRLSA